MNFIAKIVWSKTRKRIPKVGERYSTVSKFEDSDNQVDWSLVLEIIGEKQSENSALAKVYFLSDKAPQNLLRLNAKFVLTEGAREVAVGRIVEVID